MNLPGLQAARAAASHDQMAADFVARLGRRELRIAVVGLGYVGLPLCQALVDTGFDIVGFDLNAWKVRTLQRGGSYVGDVADSQLGAMLETGRFTASADPQALVGADVFVICVPTPVDEHRIPDLSYVERAGEIVAGALRPGALVSLESTTYPGATQEVLRPILEAGGLTAGRDFALAFSPERTNPGDVVHTPSSTPKVVGADTDAERRMAEALYGAFTTPVMVSNCRTAEAAKLSENIFRLVNIALVNELKHAFANLDVDVWEVIEAARTKPFGYMPFYPGPGVGGHCIPVDPCYLTWKARETGEALRLVELAGDLAQEEPVRVVEGCARVLSDRFQLALRGARVLVLGAAYKRDVDDARESPAVAILCELISRGVEAAYHDPHVAHVRCGQQTLRSLPWDAATLETFDCVVVATDHSRIDYEAVAARARLVVDTRNAMAPWRAKHGARIVSL